MVLTRLTKWGNSLALRIPQSIAGQLGMQENTTVSLELEGDHLVITRGQTLEELLVLVTDKNKPELMDLGAPRGKEMI